MSILRGLVGAVLISCLSTGAFAATMKKSTATLRDQEQAACYGDANRLCKDFVPDEGKIETCMRAKMSQVSAACRVFFK